MNEHGNDLPEGVARLEALNHAASMWVEGETEDVVLARAERMYAFLTQGRKSAQDPFAGLCHGRH